MRRGGAVAHGDSFRFATDLNFGPFPIQMRWNCWLTRNLVECPFAVDANAQGFLVGFNETEWESALG